MAVRRFSHRAENARVSGWSASGCAQQQRNPDGALRQLGPNIRWVEKLRRRRQDICALSPRMKPSSAERAGSWAPVFPATKITEIRTMIDPTSRAARIARVSAHMTDPASERPLPQQGLADKAKSPGTQAATFREFEVPHLRRLTTIVVAAAIAWCWLALGARPPRRTTPSRIIRIVVAFPASRPTDVVAQLLADKLKASLEQNVIVENQAGRQRCHRRRLCGQGRARRHGQFSHHRRRGRSNAGILSRPDYDSLCRFAPVTLVVRPTTILVVKPDHPVDSAKELVALAKDEPGAIPFASTARQHAAPRA